MKKTVLVILIMALAVSAVFASGKSDSGAASAADVQKKVAFLINTTTSQYSGGYYKAFQADINNYPSIKFTIYDGQENPTLQAQQMDEAIANGVDLIMLWPQDSKALVASAKKAQAAGIKVVVCNNNLDKSGDPYITAFLGPDYYVQGQLAADALAKALPKGGNYVALSCDPSYEAARLRLGGFQDQIKAKGYKFTMLGEPAKCDWKLELGKSAMIAFLSKYPGEIDAVYAVDDTIGNGGLQAVQEDRSGKNEKIQFVSIGGIQVILDALKEGKNYAATIYQSPSIEAPAAIKLAVDILNGKMPANKNNPMPTPIITKDNAAQFGPAY